MYFALVVIIVFIIFIIYNLQKSYKRTREEQHAAILQLATRRKLSVRSKSSEPIKKRPFRPYKSATFEKME